MATLKLTIFKAKVLKDGRHKIRVAICHKQETCYIVTNFIIDNLSQFKNGQKAFIKSDYSLADAHQHWSLEIEIEEE